LTHGLREYRSYAIFAESETWLRRNRPPDKRNALRTNIQLNPEVKKEIHFRNVKAAFSDDRHLRSEGFSTKENTHTQNQHKEINL
jgi:hypothetical protein